MGLFQNTQRSVNQKKKNRHSSHDFVTVAKEKISQCRNNPHSEIMIYLSVKVLPSTYLMMFQKNSKTSDGFQISVTAMWWQSNPNCYVSFKLMECHV